jgi:hypothetical protein
MRNEDDGHVGARQDLKQLGLQLLARERVERAEGLVHEQDAPVTQHLPWFKLARDHDGVEPRCRQASGVSLFCHWATAGAIPRSRSETTTG